MRHFARVTVLLLIALHGGLLTTRATAQSSEALETVTVVGSRIAYRDLLDTPAIAVRRQGDHLLLPITLYNDTRNEEAREREIYDSIAGLIERAGKRLAIVHGDVYPTVLDSRNLRVPLVSDPKRPDAAEVKLLVRAPLGSGDAAAAAALTRELREFVDSAPRVGRTEFEAATETALSLARPERFRYELIAAIADDTAKIRAAMGGSCKVTISGLNSRIEWQRVSVSELLLYIPYTMDMSDCEGTP